MSLVLHYLCCSFVLFRVQGLRHNNIGTSRILKKASDDFNFNLAFLLSDTGIFLLIGNSLRFFHFRTQKILL